MGFLLSSPLKKTWVMDGKMEEKGNPGRHVWESLTKKKRCVVRIKNKDDLCCARAIVTMKERVDKGSQFNNLRNGRPIEERLVKQLHQEGGVP